MDTFYFIVESIYFKIAMWVIIGGLLGVAVYNIILYMKKFSNISGRVRVAYIRMQESERDRLNKVTLERALKGVGAERTLLDKFDEMINVSGIGDIKITHKSKKGHVSIHKLTSEMCLIAWMLICGILIIITEAITQNALLGIIVPVFASFVMYILLKVVIAHRNRNIENQMIKFMNIMDNMFIYNSDVTAVLKDCSQYMNEPLKHILFDSALESEESGDSITAFNNLQNKVDSKYFKQLIHNLSVCSRHDNNYSDIIADTRNIFMVYSKTDKEKNQVKKAGALQTILVLIVGLFCIGMLGGISGNANVIDTLMNGGIIGNILLIYLTATTIISIYVGVIKVLFD